MNFSSIFNPSNKFSRILSRIFDLMALNIVFILMCIPVITIGANITAMYYVTLRMVRKEDSYTLRSYWKAFKENFKQATAIWLILVFAVFSFAADIFLCTHLFPASLAWICYVFYGLILFVILTALYVFPAQARFANPVKRTLINAMFFTFRHLPSTAAMLAIIIIPPLLVLQAPDIVFFYYVPYCLLLGFSLAAYLNSILLHRIFQKYISIMEEHARHSETDTYENR